MRTLVVATAISLVVAGCATTRQPRQDPVLSGFLGDYTELQPGEGDQAALVYVSDADWASYDAVLIDSVTMWRTSQTETLSEEERQALTDYAFLAVHDALMDDYRIVSEPGPGVIRLRLAITQATGAKVVVNTVTSVVPPLRLVTTLGGLAADKAVFVGQASVEAELIDTMTGRQLAAAVDERWGTKAVRGGILEWSDVKNALDFWAERMRARLKELRDGS